MATCMNKSPKLEKTGAVRLKPTRYDALVVLVVLLLAGALGARYWFAPTDTGALTAVVSIDGVEVERFLFDNAERSYQNNGYTVHVAVTPDGVRVDHADCPTQDCVRTGTIRRAGQSIVCLPARVVISIVGGADAPYDAVAG